MTQKDLSNLNKAKHILHHSWNEEVLDSIDKSIQDIKSLQEFVHVARMCFSDVLSQDGDPIEYIKMFMEQSRKFDCHMHPRNEL